MLLFYSSCSCSCYLQHWFFWLFTHSLSLSHSPAPSLNLLNSIWSFSALLHTTNIDRLFSKKCLCYLNMSCQGCHFRYDPIVFGVTFDSGCFFTRSFWLCYMMQFWTFIGFQNMLDSSHCGWLIDVDFSLMFVGVYLCCWTSWIMKNCWMCL